MSEKNWYDKNYKKILILPALVLAISIIYLGIFFSQNGDIINKDVSLAGGTTITVFDSEANIDQIKTQLQQEFPDIIIRGISNIRTQSQQGFFVESTAHPDELKPSLENILGYTLNSENSSTEFTGESVSGSFYQQLRIAVFIAFIFMAIVVFFIFKTPVPSLAVIISAFADITMTLAVVNLLNFQFSIGGVVALLMLVGYSVDTDILLTSRVLKKQEGSLNERMYGALKTGLTMTITSIIAISVALAIIYSFSETLREIFTILLIGLVFDVFNTWTTNSSILRWYADKKNIK